MTRIVLTDNKGHPGHYRTEAILTNQGVCLATSQRDSINLGTDRPVYDYDAVYLTFKQMDELVRWWQHDNVKVPATIDT